MSQVHKTIRQHYGLEISNLAPQQGGWSSLAYRMTANGQPYFLKLYEQSRASTPKWTALINDYAPVLQWLHQNSGLNGKIPVPLMTQNGQYQCADDDGIYLLYPYIEGETIGPRSLTNAQTVQFAEILAELHCYDEHLPLPLQRIKEDFALPFAVQLKRFLAELTQNEPRTPKLQDMYKVLEPYNAPIHTLIDKTEQLARYLRNRPLKMVLCHTDLHHWNLMQAKEQLILIDWEGLRLAPVEADFMFLIDQPYYKTVLDVYRRRHPNFALQPEILRFYQGRRKLEDLWEWIEQLLFDEQDDNERADTLASLAKDLREWI